MSTAWMDAQFVFDFYQACLTLLVWLLASFAGLGILASVMFLCVEYATPLTRSASRSLKPPSEIGVQVGSDSSASLAIA
jgi:hypothetical protein